MSNAQLGDSSRATVAADVKSARLSVEFTQTGWLVTVRDGKTMEEIKHGGGTETTLDAAKKCAEEIARNYLADSDLRIPAINWSPLFRKAKKK